MGHEIAHALREHSRERASEQTVANVGITILATVAGLGQLGQKGMEYAYQGLLGLPNSRVNMKPRPIVSALNSPRGLATTPGLRSPSGKKWAKSVVMSRQNSCRLTHRVRIASKT
jgi:hypothetical protein